MRPCALLFLCVACLHAQDPFEIHVYEYEPLPRGEYTYEAHLNYVAKGTGRYSGTVAPTKEQLHFSSEFTAGITDEFRAAFTLLTAMGPGQPWEYAGIRILPHFYAPRSWKLPVNLGVVAELSLTRSTYDENPRVLEIRPIVEKHLGRLELDGNPTFARALKGPGTRDGWVFEPAGRIGWRASSAFTPSLEYYSSWGPLHEPSALSDQVHQVFAGGDLRLGERLTWSFGVGVGITETGNRIVLKSRFELPLGRKKP